MISEKRFKEGWVIPRDGGHESPSWNSTPLWKLVINRMAGSLFWVPLLVMVLWPLGWLLRASMGFGTVMLITVATAAVSSVLITLVERPAVARARNLNPGGWDYAIWHFTVPPAVGAVIGWWQEPRLALPSGLAALIVFWALGLLTKPWRRTLSRTEYQGNWEATRKWLRENQKHSGPRPR